MRIYNTLSRKKETFVPIEPGKVKIYACGPTVYNFFHIGNARPFIVFDALRQYLKYREYEVTFVQNFTDVDDKIINRGREEGKTPLEISETYIKEYYIDAEALNIKKADVHPKVTENMDEIIALIQTLIEKGFAYEVEGDVYYETDQFEGYGKLSGQNMDEIEMGARIEVDEKKKKATDFALWKHQKQSDEVAWDSPWGKGRPGWHIECSAMATKYLGETIDIHGGGQDLAFPHHENEIAQSEGATGKPLANYWMHNGYITIDNEKMSKSKGNFFTVRDIVKEYDPQVVRFFILSGHYRSPINFSRELMEQAKNGYNRIKTAKRNLEYLREKSDGPLKSGEETLLQEIDAYREKFIQVMDDDFNTASGISVIFELVKTLNSQVQEGASFALIQSSLDLLNELSAVLGILKDTEEVPSEDKEITDLVEERNQAKKDKDFKRADEIRDILKAQGITLEDTSAGVRIIRNN